IRDKLVTGVQTCALPILKQIPFAVWCKVRCKRSMVGIGGSPGEQKSASGFAPIRPAGNFFLFSNANDHTKRILEFTSRYSRPPGLATFQLRSFCFGRLAFDFR